MIKLYSTTFSLHQLKPYVITETFSEDIFNYKINLITFLEAKLIKTN